MRQQCDQIVLFLFGHLQQFKYAPIHKTCVKVGSNICQILNKPERPCR